MNPPFPAPSFPVRDSWSRLPRWRCCFCLAGRSAQPSSITPGGARLGHIDTWWRLALYHTVPAFAGWLIVFAILWIAHARGMRFAGARLRGHALYGWIVTAVIALVAMVVAAAAIDGWIVVRYFGGHEHHHRQ